MQMGIKQAQYWKKRGGQLGKASTSHTYRAIERVDCTSKEGKLADMLSASTQEGR